jgi:hypothetical protein
VRCEQPLFSRILRVVLRSVPYLGTPGAAMSEHEGPAHAPLAPSSAHRWMHCPGSVTLSLGKPDGDNEFTREGTMLHEIIAQLVRDRVRPDDFDEIRRDGWTEEQVGEYTELLRACLECFWARYREGDVVLVETRVYFPDDSDVWGTSDVILIGSNRIESIDWKFGFVEVDAIENEQLLIYLLAAYFKFDFLGSIVDLIATVCQPRCSAPKEWRFSGREEIQRHREAVRDGARATREQADRLQDGDWCRFCPSLAVCPQVSSTALAVAQSDFDVLDVVATATPAELSNAMKLVPRIQAWLKAVNAEVMIRLNEGKEVPDFKLVEGRRGRRKWNMERKDEITRWTTSNLGLQAYETKIRTVAQIEKIAKKVKANIPEDLYEQSRGKLHVAPLSDPRDSVIGAQLDFDVLEGDEDE